VIDSEMVGILGKYIQERGAREQSQFSQAQKNHSVVSKEFLRLYPLYTNVEIESRFRKLVKMYPDGVMRNADPHFDGTKTAGIFIGKDTVLSAELKRKIVISYDLVQRFGIAFRTNFQDFYFSFSENSIVLFWPEDPKWVFNATSKLRIDQEIYHSAAAPKNNKKRTTVWTDLFYDKVGKLWMTTATTPLYLGNQYLGNVSHDVMVKELLDRTIDIHLDGASNYIMTGNGNVVAGRNIMDYVKQNQGVVKISDLNDKHLMAVWNAVENTDKVYATTHAKNADIDALIAYHKLEGPDWIFVTTYPKSRIWWTAINNAGWVFVAGVFSLVIELYLLYQILVTRVRKPLKNLIGATERLSQGDYNITVSSDQNDEIGNLANAIQIMSESLQDRDRKIEKYNSELEHLVQKRTTELAEQRLIAMHSAKMAALGEMAAGIAHEINTPLAIIALNAERIAQATKERPIEGHKLVLMSGIVGVTVERISKIVTGLRIFARDGTVDPFRPENLYDILQNTLDLCYEKYSASGVKIELEIQSGLPLIECQSVQLSQVFVNFLSNAYDAITNMPEKWIRIRVTETSEAFVIYFTDSGLGLKSDQQSKLFQPFFTTKKVGEGVGMGLSVSKGIVELHHGSISLNTKNENTQFILTLPKKHKNSIPKVG
ncbi:MAG: sensor histidine kinase, partial [Pseudobdellovibrionaceae bacterium]